MCPVGMFSRWSLDVTAVALLPRVSVTAESCSQSGIEWCCHVCHAVTRMSLRSLSLSLPTPVMKMDESGKKIGDFLRSALSVIGGE